MTGEKVCATRRCDRYGVPTQNLTDASAGSAMNIGTVGQGVSPQTPSPSNVPSLVSTREQTMVAFLNANPTCVGVLPPLDPDVLLEMLRSKSKALEDLCNKMSEDQLELFIKKFVELPHTQTLREDRLMMNRLINLSLTKGQERRTSQGTKYKVPTVATVEPVLRPHGWACINVFVICNPRKIESS